MKETPRRVCNKKEKKRKQFGEQQCEKRSLREQKKNTMYTLVYMFHMRMS